MIPAAFDYLAPVTLEEATRALAAHGEEAKLLAGGHSLIPLLKLRLAHPALLIDLHRIQGLDTIIQHNDKIVIGALATHYQIETSELLKKRCPLLPQTAREIGDVQVRNRGTIGGSLAHADPSADWPAAVLALGAELTLRGPQSERRLAAEEFFVGAMSTAIKADEILTEIRVPAFQRRCGSAYLKMAQQASGFAVVGVAVFLSVDAKGRCAEIGVGLTGLSDKPFRAHTVEERLHGIKLTPKLIATTTAQVADGIDPLEDLHADAEFRAHLARVCAARAVQEAAKRAGGSRR